MNRVGLGGASSQLKQEVLGVGLKPDGRVLGRQRGPRRPLVKDMRQDAKHNFHHLQTIFTSQVTVNTAKELHG